MAKSSLTRSPVPKRVAMSAWSLNPSVGANKGTFVRANPSLI
jgi:hypothetical protein